MYSNSLIDNGYTYFTLSSLSLIPSDFGDVDGDVHTGISGFYHSKTFRHRDSSKFPKFQDTEILNLNF